VGSGLNTQRGVGQRSNDRVSDTLRLSKSPSGTMTTRTGDRTGSIGQRMNLRDRFRDRSARAPYRDRPNLIRHTNHRVHEYRDYRNHIRRRIVWPRYNYLVHYRHGPYFTFRYVYPYYHRKYVFVSLGGYWPLHYRYVRYYWYGCHPYDWYGYYPVAYEVPGDTYNYYTYNNYYGNEGEVVGTTGVVPPAGAMVPVDHTTFADIREKLAQQAAEPYAQTLADTYFENAILAFENADYSKAIEDFAKASELAPDDVILPFAYSQALFANGQYPEAAAALRAALEKVGPDKEGVFYPRGLYADEDTLLQQIECLMEQADMYSFDADLQLLLGYHLLGIGETYVAIEPLQKASEDQNNAVAAAILLELAEKLKAEEAERNAAQTMDAKTESSDQVAQ
jgi:hypothetical protein